MRPLYAYLERLAKRIFTIKPKRLELRCMTWAEADKLLMDCTLGWKLAIPEEDNNRAFGVVWLERVEMPNAKLTGTPETKEEKHEHE